MNDLESARTHALAFLRHEPRQSGRVLFDPDLSALRSDTMSRSALETQIRSSRRGPVRQLAFERRHGSDLDVYLIAEDGLDLRRLTQTPDRREYNLRFSGDGRYLLFLAGRGRRAGRSVDGNFRRIVPLPDGALYSMDLQTGVETRLADSVHIFRVAADGQTVLYARRPSDNAPVEVHGVAAGGGASTLYARLDAPAATWCFELEPSGALLVADGYAYPSPAYRIRVARFREGTLESELVPRPAGRSYPSVNRATRRPAGNYGFSACGISDGALQLGSHRVPLASPSIHRVEGAALGDHLRSVRHYYGHVTPTRVFVTADHGESVMLQRHYPSGDLSPLNRAVDYSMGMADFDDASVTTIVSFAPDGTGYQRHDLGGYLLAYAPRLSRDGVTLSYTAVRRERGEGWILLSAPDGTQSRPLVPGQYAIWRPVP